MYSNRFYRNRVEPGELATFQITIEESDLFILCDRDLRAQAMDALRNVRKDIEAYIGKDRAFLYTLEPHEVPQSAPAVVRRMAEAAGFWGVGPMAAVAGAVADAVADRLLEESDTVIVENGGDTFVKANRKVRFGLHAGEVSPFSDAIRFEADARQGLGVCTSSGVVGPSLSFGKADAVVAIAGNAAFADAAATAIGNRVKGPEDVTDRLFGDERTKRLEGLIACSGDRIALWGNLELT